MRIKILADVRDGITLPINYNYQLAGSPVSLAALTVEDIEKIGTKIQEAETRIKENTTTQIENIKILITWPTALFVAMIALIGIPLVVLTVMIGWRSTRDHEQEKINQELRGEIETLKQQQTVRP